MGLPSLPCLSAAAASLLEVCIWGLLQAGAGSHTGPAAAWPLWLFWGRTAPELSILGAWLFAGRSISCRARWCWHPLQACARVRAVALRGCRRPCSVHDSRSTANTKLLRVLQLDQRVDISTKPGSRARSGEALS